MHNLRYTILTLTLLVFTVAGGMLATADAAGPNPVVIMDTTMGRIIIMLEPKAAPKTVENFLKYVDAGFYDKTIFHRVITQEMLKVEDPKKQSRINIVQGGGFTYPMREKRPLFRPIVNESNNGLSNRTGTIAMARTGDPNSATSQFFFNLADNTGLNPMTIDKKRYHKYKDEKEDTTEYRPGYCAFGKVIRGWDTVEKIHKVKTSQRGRHKDVPMEPVYIIKAYRAK